MARESNEIKIQKVKILDDVADSLKNKSIPFKNLYTLNNLLQVTNEELVKIGLTKISPSSIKGKKASKYYVKYTKDVNDFKEYLGSSKKSVKSNILKKIKEQELQIVNLCQDSMKYKDEAIRLSKALELHKEEIDNVKKHRDSLLAKINELQKSTH